jgi:hypothetical protein
MASLAKPLLLDKRANFWLAWQVAEAWKVAIARTNNVKRRTMSTYEKRPG